MLVDGFFSFFFALVQDPDVLFRLKEGAYFFQIVKSLVHFERHFSHAIHVEVVRVFVIESFGAIHRRITAFPLGSFAGKRCKLFLKSCETF